MQIQVLDAIAIVVALTAVLAYVNHRFVKLPPNIGVLVFSIVVQGLSIGPLIARLQQPPR